MSYSSHPTLLRVLVKQAEVVDKMVGLSPIRACHVEAKRYLITWKVALEYLGTEISGWLIVTGCIFPHLDDLPLFLEILFPLLLFEGENIFSP